MCDLFVRMWETLFVKLQEWYLFASLSFSQAHAMQVAFLFQTDTVSSYILTFSRLRTCLLNIYIMYLHNSFNMLSQ